MVCECCEHAIEDGDEWAICSQCGWEHDPFGMPHDPGPNSVSLDQARMNFRAFGASDAHWFMRRNHVAPTDPMAVTLWLSGGGPIDIDRWLTGDPESTGFGDLDALSIQHEVEERVIAKLMR